MEIHVDSDRGEVRISNPRPGARRNSLPGPDVRREDDAEPSIRRKSYCVDGPTNTRAKRVGESDDSAERNLEVLRSRDSMVRGEGGGASGRRRISTRAQSSAAHY